MEILHIGRVVKRVYPENWLLKQSSWLDPLEPVILGWITQGAPGLGTTQKQEWDLFLLECMLHNVATMQRKEHQRHSWGSEPYMEESAPEHPSVWILLGSPDAEILKLVEQAYSGEFAVVPVYSPANNRIGCMRELCWELARHMATASLQSEVGLAGPLQEAKDVPTVAPISQTCSPSAWPWGMEVTKQLKEDTPTG